LEDLDNTFISIPLDRYLELLVFEYEYNLLLNSGAYNWNYFEDVWEEYDADALRKEIITRIIDKGITRN
jgi:DUF971 family protein